LAAQRERRVIIVIDGLDSLKQLRHEEAENLLWLPSTLFTHARLIFSVSLPDERGFTRRLQNWGGGTLVELEKISREGQQQIVSELLTKRSKMLNEKQRELVLGHPHSHLPLFLLVLVEELCEHGKYETLDEAIDWYLQSSDIEGLFGRFLRRMEREYSGLSSGTKTEVSLLPSFFSLLLLSEQGLTEIELLEILGIDGKVLSSLISGSSRFLFFHSGLLSLRYPQLSKAVKELFCPEGGDAERKILLGFAGHLSSMLPPIPEEKEKITQKMFDLSEGEVDRIILELPYAYLKTGSYEQLRRILIHPSLFNSLYDATNLVQTASLWFQVLKHLKVHFPFTLNKIASTL